jgi:Tn3 transposase DDE domain
MDNWQSTFLGLKQLPRELTAFEIEAHGHTDFGMALARGGSLDLCPRLKALKDRHLYLPRGCEVPQILKPI